MINYCHPTQCLASQWIFLPYRFVLLWLQVLHWGFLTGWPGTCSTSLQNISGPLEPQVAFAFMSAMVARFSTAGNSPERENKTHPGTLILESNLKTLIHQKSRQTFDTLITSCFASKCYIWNIIVSFSCRLPSLNEPKKCLFSLCCHLYWHYELLVWNMRGWEKVQYLPSCLIWVYF